MPLFEVKEVDTQYYREHLEDFLPEKMIDIHTHVYKKEIRGKDIPREKRLVSWPALVAEEDPIEDLLETYKLMFPGKKVYPCIFPTVQPEDKIDEMNAYANRCGKDNALPVLLYVHPTWPNEELERKLTEGTYQGIKVYLNLSPSYIPGNEIRIFDYLTPGHLSVLDKLGLMVMLHIPRSGRLGDPVNLAQIMEIEEQYTNLQLILAHVGRAYCREDAGNAFKVLGETERLVFDFSANTNSWIFARALETVGSKRMLFGSDLPISRMRMRRICRDGIYVNLVPRGLYGDVSGDKNMGELDGKEAEALSFFMYEEIKAMKEAAGELGLGKKDIEDIFYGNARRIIETTGFSFDE